MVALASNLMNERQDERIAEVADILATGVLRHWRAQRCLPRQTCLPPGNRRFSGDNFLEVTDKTSPDVAVN